MTNKLLANTPWLLEEVERRLERSGAFGFDTESSGPNLIDQDTGLPGNKMVNMYKSKLAGFSLYFPDDDTAFYVPRRHQGSAEERLTGRVLSKAMDGHLVAHNVKHELLACREWGGGWPKRVDEARWEDSLLVMWLLNYWSGTKSPYGLKALAKTFLDMDMADFRTVSQGRQFHEIPAEEALSYACDDAIASYKLWERFAGDMSKYSGMAEAYRDVELPFVRVLREMEDTGVGVDVDFLDQYAGKLASKLEPLLVEWKQLCGEMNPGSSKQLQDFYDFGDWDTTDVPMKKTGYSTEGEFLETHADHAPTKLGREAARLKLAIAETSKLLTTYTAKMRPLAEQYPDGRLHCDWNGTAAATGRLSSSYPCLANIPVRTEDGKALRAAFIPKNGVVMSCDFSQIQLRVLAGLLKRGALYDAFIEGKIDAHEATGRAAGVSRDMGKTLNFAVLFGARESKVARMLGIPKAQAKKLLDSLHKGAPEFAWAKDVAVKNTRRRGYAVTLGGRIWRLPDIDATNTGRRWYAERRAFCGAIQGGERDIVARAMVGIYKRVREMEWRGPRPAMCAQHYDDIMSDLAPEDVDAYAAMKVEEMHKAGSVLAPVPVKVGPKVGKNWLEVK